MTFLLHAGRIPRLVAAATLFALFAVVAVGLIMIGAAQGAQPAATFPAATIRVTTWQSQEVTRSAERTAIQHIEYRNKFDWTSSLIADTLVPESVGSWASFRGNISESYDAKFNNKRTMVVEQDRALLPDEFLNPSKIRTLASRGWTKTSEDATTETYENVDAGAGDPSRPVRTVLRFDRASGLPLSVEMYRENRLLERRSFERLK